MRTADDYAIWKGVVAGVAGGAVAAWTMTQFQSAMTRMLERSDGHGQQSRQGGEREPATEKAAAALTEPVIERKLDALHCHTSQVYEWLPYNVGRLDEVPSGESERRRWLAERYVPRFENVANDHRSVLARWYGPARAEAIRYAEAFEVCEYGSQPSAEDLRRLFPFFPES